VIPHLKRVCRKDGKDFCEIDLLAEFPCPIGYQDVEPLRLSLNSLQKKFIEILHSEGLKVKELKEAKIRYEFPDHGDDYTGNSLVTVKCLDDSVIAYAVGSEGKTAEKMKQNTEQVAGGDAVR
jgi:hypothetical protein